MTNNEQIDLQNKLLKWLSICKFASWKEINEALKSMLNSEEKYPAYSYFEPLLRNGIVEIAYDGKSEKIGFCSKYKCLDEIEGAINCTTLSLLEAIPRIKQCIRNMESVSINLNGYKKLNLKKYPHEYENSNNLTIGIYKRKDESWLPRFLYDGKKTFFIPDNSTNPDAYNIACCFVRLSNNEVLFKYNVHDRTLLIKNYSEHPYLVTRALYLSNTDQLRDPSFLRPVSSPYSGITLQHIAALKRIYNPKAIEVLK